MTQDKVKFLILRLFIGIQIYTMIREKHCSRGSRHLYKVRVKIQQPHLILVIKYVINYTVSPRALPISKNRTGTINEFRSADRIFLDAIEAILERSFSALYPFHS